MVVIEKTSYLSDTLEGIRYQDEQADPTSRAFKSDLGNTSIQDVVINATFVIEPSLGNLLPRVVVWCDSGDESAKRRLKSSRLKYRVEVWADAVDYWRKPLTDALYGSLELEENHLGAARNNMFAEEDNDNVLLHEIDLNPLSWAENEFALYACRSLTVSVHIMPMSEDDERHLVDDPITLHNFQECTAKIEHFDPQEIWHDVDCCEQTRTARDLYKTGSMLSSMPGRAADGHRFLHFALQALLVVNSRGLYPYDRHYIRLAQIYMSSMLSSRDLALQAQSVKDSALAFEMIAKSAPHAGIMWRYLRPYEFEPYFHLSFVLEMAGNPGPALHMVDLTRNVIEVNFDGAAKTDHSAQALRMCEMLEKRIWKKFDAELDEQRKLTTEDATTTSEDGGATTGEALTDDELDAPMHIQSPPKSPKKVMRKRKRDRKTFVAPHMDVDPSATIETPLSPSPGTDAESVDDSDGSFLSDEMITIEPSNTNTRKITAKAPLAKRPRMRSFLLSSGATARYPCWAAMADSDYSDNDY